MQKPRRSSSKMAMRPESGVGIASIDRFVSRRRVGAVRLVISLVPAVIMRPPWFARMSRCYLGATAGLKIYQKSVAQNQLPFAFFSERIKESPSRESVSPRRPLATLNQLV
jgi:hypothetical protein